MALHLFVSYNKITHPGDWKSSCLRAPVVNTSLEKAEVVELADTPS
jgi:hypothetical protein